MDQAGAENWGHSFDVLIRLELSSVSLSIMKAHQPTGCPDRTKFEALAVRP